MAVDNLEENSGTLDPEPALSNSRISQKNPDRANIDRVNKQVPKSAPNISLNMSPMQSQTELYIALVFGILLQCGILGFAAITVFHSPWNETIFLKDGERVPKKSFVLLVVGSAILALGMMSCSFVIERSTHEDIFDVRNEDPRITKKFRLMWLQRHGTVSDQLFDSFSIFSQGDRDLMLTSRRSENLIQGSRSWKTTRSDRTLEVWLKNVAATTLEAWTVVATIISLAGFILQFVALRELHWSISVAQLGATGVMTCVRVGIRRDVAKAPETMKLLRNFELDDCATRLAWYGSGFWPDGDQQNEARTNDDRKNEYRNNEDKKNAEGISHEPFAWDLTRPEDAKAIFDDNVDNLSDSMAQYVLDLRIRLGQLSGWQGPGSKVAVSVANSIDAVMNTLFPDRQEPFTWYLDAQYGKTTQLEGSTRAKPERIRFRVTNKGGRWSAGSGEIDAALSLMLYTRYQIRKDTNLEDVTGGGLRKQDMAVPRDWLRKGDAAVDKQCMRILCPSTPQSRRDLSWWMPGNSPDVFIVRKINEVSDEDGKDTIEIANSQIIGRSDAEEVPNKKERPNTGTQPKAPKNQSKYKIKLLSETLDPAPDGKKSNVDDSGSFIAVISNQSLEAALGEQLFTAFMFAITAVHDPEWNAGQTGVSSWDLDSNDTTKWQEMKLHNTVLSRLTQDVEKSGLGPLDAAYRCLVPPLHLTRKLPYLRDVIEYARDCAQNHQIAGRWTQSGKIYKQLLQATQFYKDDDPVKMKAAVLCTEFLRQVSRAATLCRSQCRSKAELLALTALEDEFQAELKTLAAARNILGVYSERGLIWRETFGPSVGKMDNTLFEDAFQISALHRLVKNGDIGKLKKEGIDSTAVNAKDMMECTPLHLAVMLPGIYRNDIVAALLESKSDPNSVDIAGWTPLHHLASHTSKYKGTILIRLLEKHGAELDARGSDGLTPLHCAAMSSEGEGTAKVDSLIRLGANVMARDNSRNTPLHWAAYCGDPINIGLLLQNGSKINARNDDGRNPLHLASIRGDHESVSQLMNAGKTYMDGYVNEEDNEGIMALSWAAKMGRTVAVETLMLEDSNQNSRNQALLYAAEEGHEGIVRTLLQGGSDINTRDRSHMTALMWAAKGGHKPVVQVLLRNRPDINATDQDNMTALLWAAQDGTAAVVEALLKEKSVDVNATNKHNSTALIEAAKGGDVKVVELLLDRQMDVAVNVRDTKSGGTALMYAAGNGDTDVVEALLEWKDIDVNVGDITNIPVVKGGDPEAQPIHGTPGSTALICAAEGGHAEVVRILLDQKKEVNVNAKKGTSNYTALMCAAEKGYVDVVKVLLDMRADIDVGVATDDSGETAIDLAIRYGHLEVRDLFSSEVVQAALIKVRLRELAEEEEASNNYWRVMAAW